MPDSHALLHDLLRTPSPTGHETALQELIAERFRGIAERRETDLHGNLFLGVNTGAERAVMLAAHCDQIGFMIKHVDRNGYLFVDHLGGVDEAIVAGERVIVHGARGPVAGVFGKKATHLQSTSEREEVPRHSEVWIDIGVKDREEAEGHVRVGDYVTFEPRLTPLRNGRIAAPGLDDKAGLFAVLEALRLCAERDLSVALWVVSTVQEEVGLRGATTATFAVRPEVGIAVDVAHASDDPGNTRKTTIPCKFGGGPAISHGPNTNPVVERLLWHVAREHDIAAQSLPSADLEANDSKAIQVAAHGVAAASVSIPLRNMHTQAEVCQLSDIDDTARLLAEFVAGIDDRTDFRPLGSALAEGDASSTGPDGPGSARRNGRRRGRAAPA